MLHTVVYLHIQVWMAQRWREKMHRGKGRMNANPETNQCVDAAVL